MLAERRGEMFWRTDWRNEKASPCKPISTVGIDTVGLIFGNAGCSEGCALCIRRAVATYGSKTLRGFECRAKFPNLAPSPQPNFGDPCLHLRVVRQALIPLSGAPREFGRCRELRDKGMVPGRNRCVPPHVDWLRCCPPLAVGARSRSCSNSPVRRSARSRASLALRSASVLRALLGVQLQRQDPNTLQWRPGRST